MLLILLCFDKIAKKMARVEAHFGEAITDA